MKVALAPFLEGQDIVIGSLHEILRAGYSEPPAIKKLLNRPDIRLEALAASFLKGRAEGKNIAVKRYFSKFLGPDAPHPTADRASEWLGDVWHSYKKVCFVRNPYEQVASDFLWRRRVSKGDFDFYEFLLAIQDRQRRGKDAQKRRIKGVSGVRNWEMIAINDTVVADYVGRYENIDADFNEMMQFIGLNGVTRLGREKARGGGDYARLYGARERRLACEIFRQEANELSYEFPY